MQDLSLHQSQFYDLTSERIYFRDQDFGLISANRAFLQDLCCDQFQDVQGSRLDEINVLDDGLKSLLLDIESQIPITQKSQVREQVHCNIKNKDSVISAECHPVFADDGNFRGIVCRYSIKSVSEFLGIEKVLIDALMRNTQDSIYFKDLNSRFIRANDSMVERLGARDLDSVIGTTDFDYWDFDCAQGFFQSERKIIETRQPLTGVCEQEIRHDGRKTWVISSKMPLEDEFGNVFGTFGISKDITELKETEFKLQETNQQLVLASRRAGMAEIANNVIHNVGNVLNSVNVSLALSRSMVKDSGIENLIKTADLLDANKDNPEFLSKDPKGTILPKFLRMSAQSISKANASVMYELENLGRNIDHIKTIISMQQQYAGVASVTENVALIPLVEDAIRIGQCTMSDLGVEIETHFLIDIEAEIDKHRVLQILVNLIRNAKHACEEANHDAPKRISVTIDQSTEDFFTIDISDNGVGIERENLTSIFSHGFTTKENGKGFGLHSSANAAKELGGSLIATSAGKGQGAAFVLSLPVAPTPKTKAKMPDQVTSIEMQNITTAAHAFPAADGG
jgi:PAS domain S-box-containing protein